MKLRHSFLRYVRPFWRYMHGPRIFDEPKLLAHGWEKYAAEWEPNKFPVLAAHHVGHLGDEWTGEDASSGECPYGLTPEIIARFENYIDELLLRPYLPVCATEGLEIGPGGGRFTELLLPRTKLLNVAEPSKIMLRHLKQRFSGVLNLHYYHTDGVRLPPLRTASQDYVFAFDVFVHFEPRLIYWYLQQAAELLRPGGIGIIHYANTVTPIGWQLFERELKVNLRGRTSFGSFGVMCPQLMEKFLRMLDLEIISIDVELIPRDAIAVFRRRKSEES